MNDNSLSLAFCDTLNLDDDIVASLSELSEVGLDSILEEGILKDIPFLSTVRAVYKIGNTIKERHNIKKLAVFINEINQNVISEEKRHQYQEKLNSNEEFRNQEMEYLIVLIDRYISLDKPRMLAKLYLAYLDGYIVWEEMIMYAEVIDRFILLDSRNLLLETKKYIVHRNIGGESIARLVALGLLAEETNKTPFNYNNNGSLEMTLESMQRFQVMDRVYIKTEFGEKLANILR